MQGIVTARVLLLFAHLERLTYKRLMSRARIIQLSIKT